MTNPYQPPQGEPHYSPARSSIEEGRERARAAVQGPAIGLLVVAAICVALLMVTIPFNVFLLAVGGMNGRVGGLEVDETKFMQIVVRMLWSVAMFAASAYCVFGAWKMKSLKAYQHARNAAIVAAIPCLGPCCLLGIPFGIWAYVTLGKPEVQSAFES
jgi:hypothetical protein